MTRTPLERQVPRTIGTQGKGSQENVLDLCPSSESGWMSWWGRWAILCREPCMCEVTEMRTFGSWGRWLEGNRDRKERGRRDEAGVIGGGPVLEGLVCHSRSLKCIWNAVGVPLNNIWGTVSALERSRRRGQKDGSRKTGCRCTRVINVAF